MRFFFVTLRLMAGVGIYGKKEKKVKLGPRASLRMKNSVASLEQKDIKKQIVISY